MSSKISVGTVFSIVQKDFRITDKRFLPWWKKPRNLTLGHPTALTSKIALSTQFSLNQADF